MKREVGVEVFGSGTRERSVLGLGVEKGNWPQRSQSAQRGRGKGDCNHRARERHGIHEREERLIEDNSPYLVRGFQAWAGECAPFREVSKGREQGCSRYSGKDCLLRVGMSVPAHPQAVGLGWRGMVIEDG